MPSEIVSSKASAEVGRLRGGELGGGAKGGGNQRGQYACEMVSSLSEYGPIWNEIICTEPSMTTGMHSTRP